MLLPRYLSFGTVTNIKHVGRARKVFVQWMVAMITIMKPEDLLKLAERIISTLVRFIEEGPVASILKSSLKGCA